MEMYGYFQVLYLGKWNLSNQILKSEICENNKEQKGFFSGLKLGNEEQCYATNKIFVKLRIPNIVTEKLLGRVIE